MRISSCLAWASVALAAYPDDVFNRAQRAQERWMAKHIAPEFESPALESRAANPAPPRYLNSKSQKFVVNGSAIPDVPFNVGESYAGLLPISSDPNETRKLYFWFFPSQAPQASNEIAAWFNGGPGCSSLSGLLTENGPFLFQSGTLAPVQNPYSWSRITNYVWIEQPVGVGYTQGTPNIHDEIQLAEQFKGFWKNFVDTFDLHGRDVLLTGESYAGFYVPYIANSFLKANDTNYFKLKGIAINDPIIGNDVLQQQAPIVPWTEYWSNLLYLNSTFRQQARDADAKCGYKAYREKYFQFPPPAKPWAPAPNPTSQACDLFDFSLDAIMEINPCFNLYHATDTCPFPYSHLGIVNTGDYNPPGAVIYFNRTDVKRAINAPVNSNWMQCTNVNVFPGGGDRSPGPALDGTLTNVIEKTNNVIVGSGALDMLLSTNGTLFALQNTTWNGGQGLSQYPRKPFFVPYHREANKGALGGAGNLGVWQSDRGLTFYDVQLAGHEVPGYAATAGYRSIQLLTGRIKSLNDTQTPLL